MKSFSIGRSGTCDIVLPDPTVSRRHAVLFASENGTYRFVDTSSLSGSFLFAADGWRPLTEAEVHKADRLRLGNVVTTVSDLLLRAASDQRRAHGLEAERAASEDAAWAGSSRPDSASVTTRSDAAYVADSAERAEPRPQEALAETTGSGRNRTLVERDPATGRIVVRRS
ncbi:hypothetical protein ABIE45_006317 [Methylobacterium sp. OAE515]|uniref:FHA domain-containing protein n=1 Tax=Methylobacterium sp. OAE515 TaxID=2817895 RepID=UPI0017898EE1